MKDYKAFFRENGWERIPRIKRKQTKKKKKPWVFPRENFDQVEASVRNDKRSTKPQGIQQIFLLKLEELYSVNL